MRRGRSARGISAFPRATPCRLRRGSSTATSCAGFACVDRAGRPLGTAAGVEQTPAGPLLSLTLPSGKEALVPFVAEFVVSIDRERASIVLELPDGLLEL